MKNILEYKGYYTQVEYDYEDQILYGKIEGIGDLVNFDSENASGIVLAFHEAVDDYLAFCKEVGKEPDKTYRGSFNVRMTPEMHRKAAMQAARNGMTLNQFVNEAVEEKILAMA